MYSFRKYLPSSFVHKLTSIYRRNWSCEKIPKSQNSDKATSFSSVVVNIASSAQKVKPLHNKSRCLNIIKSFLTFKVSNTRIFSYFQKVLTMKVWQNTQFTTAILFCDFVQPNRKRYHVPMCIIEKLLYNYLFYHFFSSSTIYYLYLLSIIVINRQ